MEEKTAAGLSKAVTAYEAKLSKKSVAAAKKNKAMEKKLLAKAKADAKKISANKNSGGREEGGK